VVSVGNCAPAVVSAVTEQVAALTHSCFMVAPYEGYVAVCEQLNRLTPLRTRSRSLAPTPGARRWSPSTTATTAGRT
jgi:4-aminobutyrate aminotransferase/(S)-3-amino-2-methylpropionate transaminase